MNASETNPINIESETQALALRQDQAVLPIEQPPRPAVTAAQAKVEAIAALTMKAYERAASLVLTDEEIAKLAEEFPDEAFKSGAAGKENLIYIEHAFLRDRLNQVFKPGQWAIVPRNRWAEDFTTSNGKPASRVYVEAMLIIRGCFVSESVGEMEYFPHNASQNYGDAVEGAKTAALRRCCKELGIGLQAWKKDWCEGWWQRKRSGQRVGPTPRAQQPAPKATPAPVANKPTPAPAAEVKPWPQTPKTRDWVIAKLDDPATEMNHRLALEYLRNAGMLLPTENLGDLPLRWLPLNLKDLDALRARIKAFASGAQPVKPYEPREVPGDARGTNTAPAATRFAAEATAAVEAAAPGPAPKELPPQVLAARKDPEWWRKVIVPIPTKGMRRADYLKHPQTVGELYDGRHDEATAKRLFGFIGHFEVETTWQNEQGQTRNRNAIQIEQDQIFRDALDACNDYAEAHHGDTEPPSDPNNQAMSEADDGGPAFL